MHVWLFGYGSLIWRPDIEFLDSQPARLSGYSRRFWQGSHDHRGLPDRPGRVVTLVEDAQGSCDGVAYLVDRSTADATFLRLDHREKNGYQRQLVPLEFHPDSQIIDGIVYIAPVDNHAYLGPAPVVEMALQISRSTGPSGSNRDYLFELASALRSLNFHDEHVFELEAAVKEI